MSSKRTWQVREAGPGDEPQLGELFKRVFGFDRGVAHYQWKFTNNPAGPPVIAVAEDAGRIVGQYALWPTPLRLGGKVVAGAQSLDTMTHPDYRGQGMFTVLAEECMGYAAARCIVALYGFPNENSQPGFVRKLDWDCTGEIDVLMRPLKASRHKSTPAWAAPLADALGQWMPRGSAGRFELREGVPAAADVDTLLAQWREGAAHCSVERSAERYAWRFDAQSGMQYRWCCAYDGQQLAAFAVWGIDIRNGNAVLSELIATQPDAARAALSGALGAALAAQCPVMLAVCQRGSVGPVLRRAGFMRRSGLPLIVRKLTIRTLGANVHTHANWDVFGADLDTF